MVSLVMMSLGCDPGFDVTVQVVTEAGIPVPGVTVQLDCPAAGLANYRHHMDLGMTDARGRVARSGIGEAPVDCWIHAPGHSPTRLDVGAACAERHPYRRLCRRLQATLNLEGAK